MTKYFKKLIGFVLICSFSYKVAGQLHITSVGKNYVEIQLYNQTASIKQTINPYFLGHSKLEGNTITFYVFREKYRFHNDTLFLYLNDTTIVPGIEKYNQRDSFRLMTFKKYVILPPQYEFKAKYRFRKDKFSFIKLYYTFTDAAQNNKDSLALVYARKRKTR